MIKHLSQWDIADELYNSGDWSRSASYALAEWLEDYEDSTGQDMELDTIALRCEFSEYKDIVTCIKDQIGDSYILELGISDEDTKEDIEVKCLEYLEDRTIVIPFEDGYIIQDY